jgi:TusA-related sulfurtransferase
MSSGSLDLRGTPCPVNFIRCRLALEALQPGDLLNVQLDRGEPEEMVIPGLREAGHRVEITDDSSSWVVLRVVCGG